MAPLQDTWYLEIILHLIHGSNGRDSSMFLSTFSLLSGSNTTSDTGLSTMLLLPATPYKSSVTKKCLCDFTHLPIIPDDVCFLQDHNVSNFEVPFNVCPFFPFLKWLQKKIPSPRPKFVQYVLDTPPSFMAV